MCVCMYMYVNVSCKTIYVKVYVDPYLLAASVKAVKLLQLKKIITMRMKQYGGTLSL